MTIAVAKLTKRKQEELRLIADSTYESILETAAKHPKSAKRKTEAGRTQLR